MEKTRFAKLKSTTKQRQRELIEKINSQKEPCYREVEGLKIICLPKVFYPQEDTILLAKSVSIEPNDVVLEPCSGSGFISIYIAHRAKKVHATDINKHAVDNIKDNVKLHNLDSKIEVFHADLFPNLNIKYDVIVINPPYTDNKAASVVEKCVWDENHSTVIQFFKDAKKHLKKEGRIYLSWGNFADFTFIENVEIGRAHV